MNCNTLVEELTEGNTSTKHFIFRRFSRDRKKELIEINYDRNNFHVKLGK